MQLCRSPAENFNGIAHTVGNRTLRRSFSPSLYLLSKLRLTPFPPATPVATRLNFHLVSWAPCGRICIVPHVVGVRTCTTALLRGIHSGFYTARPRSMRPYIAPSNYKVRVLRKEELPDQSTVFDLRFEGDPGRSPAAGTKMRSCLYWPRGCLGLAWLWWSCMYPSITLAAVVSMPENVTYRVGGLADTGAGSHEGGEQSSTDQKAGYCDFVDSGLRVLAVQDALGYRASLCCIYDEYTCRKTPSVSSRVKRGVQAGRQPRISAVDMSEKKGHAE